MATLTADTARWPLYLTTLEIGSAFVIDRFAERLESAMRSHPDLLYAGVDLYDPTAWGGKAVVRYRSALAQYDAEAAAADVIDQVEPGTWEVYGTVLSEEAATVAAIVDDLASAGKAAAYGSFGALGFLGLGLAAVAVIYLVRVMTGK